MECTRPITAYISVSARNPKTGGRILRFDDPPDYYFGNSDGWKQIPLPCGKCPACRLQYARTWANRCMLEAKYHDNNWFVTLTYSDDCVPHSATTGALTLEKDALSAFIKRLRKYTGQKLRYYGCGEYGSHTMRPHYHVIIFGLSLDDTVFWRRDKRGYSIFRSPTLEKAWKYGNVEVGAVTWDSCCYVARYVQKKVGNDPAAYSKLGLVPEYIRMSRRPGIGYQYFEDHVSEIYSYSDMYIATDHGGIVCKPPRYYDKQLGVLAPDVLDVIKSDRLNAIDRPVMDESQLVNTDLDYFEYQRLKEETLEARTKILLQRRDI